MFLERDLYEILGASPTATAEEITQAYRARAKQYHPDSNRGSPDVAKFMEAKGAYNVLGDEQRRKEYDLTRPPQGEGGGATETESASDSDEASGTTGTAAGSGATESNSGIKGKAGASGIHTAPHPKSRSRERPKHHDHRHHNGPKSTFELRHYPFSQFTYPGKYTSLRAIPAANASRPSMHHRARFREFTLG